MIIRQCRWPGCPVDTMSARYLWCKRHFDMVPANLRAWLASTYRPTIAGKPSPEYARAVSAVRNWCKSNPDPALPPFAAGQVVRVTEQAAGLFAGVELVVESCEIRIVTESGRDRQRWLCRLSDGSEWVATDLVGV